MSTPGVILVAEDNEVDVLLLRRAFAKACLPNPLKVVADGQEAIWYLSGKGKYVDRAQYPLPELVLLDIKMPHKNGLEVLKWIREQSNLKQLRVVMLTSSDQARDVDMAYQLGANSFVVKPADFDHLVQLSAALKGRWSDPDLPGYRAGQSPTFGPVAESLNTVPPVAPGTAPRSPQNPLV